MPLSEELGSHLLCQINLRVNLPVPRAAAVKWGSVWRNQVPWYWADALLTLKWCIPVPSWSKWWQRRNSRWANWKDMQRDGTNHGVKQESTLVQAARAVGVTSGSQVLWEPDSLAELWKTKEAQWPLLPRITKAQCLSKAITGNSTVNILIIKYQCSTHTQEFVFFTSLYVEYSIWIICRKLPNYSSVSMHVHLDQIHFFLYSFHTTYG